MRRNISAGIACGAYPFGRVVNTGGTGRRTLDIFCVDFTAWIASKTPKSAEDRPHLALVSSR